MRNSTISRDKFILSLGASALLASCAGNSGFVLPSPRGQSLKPSPRRPMSVPAGYTTTYSAGTSSLFYNGSLVATLTTDQSTWLSSLYCAFNGKTYNMTPLSAGQATVGGTYEPYPGAVVTFPSTGSGNTANVSSGGGSGYFTHSIDSSGNNIGTLYHSTMIPTVDRENWGGGTTGGGGSGCHTNVCPNGGVSPAGIAACVLHSVLALGACIGLAGAVAAAIGNPIFGLAEAGFLLAAHGFAVAEIGVAIYECEQ